MSHRVLVPDTSVLVASFFDEPPTRTAQQLVASIRRGQIRAFAPHAVTDLGSEAWRLVTEERVSPPDGWMLACAIRIPGSELWISHEHADGFVSSARVLHREVYTPGERSGPFALNRVKIVLI